MYQVYSITFANNNIFFVLKFEIGDKIALKSTAEEGVVIEFLDNKMVIVRINKTEFPVFESEIEHPYFNLFTSKQFKTKSDKVFIDNVPKENIKNVNLGSYGMHLVFMPVYKNILDDDVIEKVKIYISNNQAQAFSFHYFFESKDGETFKINSDVQAYCDFYLHDISYEHLATNPLFDISCAEILSNIKSNVNQYQEQINIKPKKIFELISKMHLDNKPFFTYFLFNTEPLNFNTQDAIKVEPYTIKKETLLPKKINKPEIEKTILPVPANNLNTVQLETNIDTYFTTPYIIDLHIENLTEEHITYSKQEKINFQLNIFAKALDRAILRGQNTLIVIHGVGKGVLKNEIHNILNQTKQVHSFVNKYTKSYGFGATEIFFKL